MIIESIKLPDGSTIKNATVEVLKEKGIAAVVIEQAVMTQARADALQLIKQRHAESLRLLSGDATPEERDTWPLQVAAASAYLAGTATAVQTQMLDDLSVDGEDKTEFCQRIIAKSDAMMVLTGKAGMKRTLEKAIESANSTEEIEQVMAAGAQQMEQAITAFKAAFS